MPELFIRGLDLKTDPIIKDICVASNETAGHTRSVLYLLVLASVLALCAVINSHYFNWTKSRLKHYSEQVAEYDSIVNETKLSVPDQVKYKDSLAQAKWDWESQKRLQITDFQTVKLPLLGNSFDIDDLITITGITFIILMVILRFTLSRERNNLNLAMKAITLRYPGEANKADFENIFKLPEYAGYSEGVVLSLINRTRRLHHYNHLSMNEIFNLPPLEINIGKAKTTALKRLIKQIAWFPFCGYMLIFLNDVSTVFNGFAVNVGHTIVGFVIGIACIIALISLSNKCTSIKKELSNLYISFMENDYQIK